LRILSLCPYDISVPGGVQKQAIGLAKSYENLGCDSTLIAPGKLDWANFVNAGDSVSFPANGSRASILVSPKALINSNRFIKREKFDILHIHEPLAPFLNWLAMYKKTAKVATFHRAGSSLFYKIFAEIFKGKIRGFDALISVSTAAQVTAESNFSITSEVFFNAIDLGITNNFVKNSDSFEITFIGRHEQRKGLDIFLQAAEILSKSDPINLKFNVVGDGPLSINLKRRFSHLNQLVWYGVLSEEKLYQIICNSSVIAVPSIGSESFGLVLLEAMAFGVPLVCSELSSYKDVAGDCALYFKTGNSADLAEKILVLYNNMDLHNSLRGKAKERVKEFSMDNLAQKYISLFEKILKSRDN
jgi:phosphatidylinositol alpha-mannosyltransferase